MISPEAALAACRFVHDAACMLLWGALAYLAVLVPRDLANDLGQRLKTFRLAAGAIAIVTTAMILPIEVAGIGTGWTDAIDPSTFSAVLFETSVGKAWQAQAFAALLLAISFAAPAWVQPGLSAGAAGLVLATFALSGHAVMHEGWLGIAHSVNDALHVLAGGAWIGALIPLLLILTSLDKAAWRHASGVALRQFSRAGHAAVALVIATGAANTALVLGRWPNDPASPYQVMLATKIAMVFVMTALAVANRYVLVPGITRNPIQTIRALRLTTAVEIGLGFTAIALVSVFGLIEPS